MQEHTLFQPDPSLKGKALVFDSGMGGLTVARELAALAPDLAIDYAADNGFFPYGDKSDLALKERLPVLAKALVEAAQPDIFVIACNTASTLALSEVRAALSIPVIGTVPAIKPAVALTRTGTIGLLATPGTIRRAYTARLIAEFASNVRVIQHGTVELVRLAEAYAAGEPVPPEAFAAELAPLFMDEGGQDMDTIVLACTHFPLVRDQLASAALHPVQFVDSGLAIAQQSLRVLPKWPAGGEGALTAAANSSGRVYLTGDAQGHERLIEVCRRFGFTQPEIVSLQGAPVSG